MAKAIESQGVTISVATGSPNAQVNIGNVIGIKGPGGAASVIDVTNLDSSAKEKLMGLPDEGQVTLDINYDPDNATHIVLRAARRARTRCEFVITLTDSTATTLHFFAYVLSFSMDISVDQAVKVSVTLEVDGAVLEA